MKIKSREELKAAIDGYFAEREPRQARGADGELLYDKKGVPVMLEARPQTLSGLARSMGIDRRTLLNYSKTEEYGDLVEEARQRVEEYQEERLFDRDGANGAKFALANNFGWKERVENTNRDMPPTPEEIAQAEEAMRALGYVKADDAA